MQKSKKNCERYTFISIPIITVGMVYRMQYLAGVLCLQLHMTGCLHAHFSNYEQCRFIMCSLVCKFMCDQIDTEFPMHIFFTQQLHFYDSVCCSNCNPIILKITLITSHHSVRTFCHTLFWLLHLHYKLVLWVRMHPIPCIYLHGLVISYCGFDVNSRRIAHTIT